MLPPLDQDPVYEQSAAIVYRDRGESLEVLLMTNLKGTRWVLPKGLLEPHLDAAASAAKEAEEEAGVLGEIHQPSVGEYSYRKWGGVCEVEVFHVKATGQLEEYEEKGMRELTWVSPEEAAEMVREKALERLLARVPKLVRALA